MVLAGKLLAETLVRVPAEKFYEMYCRKPHHVSNASPEKVQKCHLHEGDWGTPGSVIQWNYAIDGKNCGSKHLIEVVDEENKSITFKVIEGDILKEYTSFKIVLQTISKEGDFTLVCWILEYEKLNEDIRVPIKELEFLIHLNEHIDDHLGQA